MQRFIVGLLLMGPALFVCADESDTAIYEAVLDYARQSEAGYFVVIGPTVQPQQLVPGISQFMKLTSAGMITGLIKANEKPSELPGSFQRSSRYIVVPKGEIGGLGWGTDQAAKRIEAAYPDALATVRFSRPLILQGGAQALVYAELFSHDDGEGNLYLLTRSGDRWIFAEGMTAWKASW